MQIRVKLSNDGFFTNFNTALDWLAFGDEHGVHVGIDWTLDRSQQDWDFSYGEVGGGNLWDSFFEPIPCAAETDLVVSRPWTPNLGGFRGYGLYNNVRKLAQARQRLHNSLQRHIRLKSDINARIDAFAGSLPPAQVVIGVHLRNPVESTRLYCRPPPPTRYFNCIDRIVRQLPPGTSWRIFAASDREGYIETLARRYPGRVSSQSGISRALADSGEIHRQGARGRSLGLDVISDCWLLSRCSYLIGVQSSVCLAASAINPQFQFVNAQTFSVRLGGRIEYQVKKLYCDLFEGPSADRQRATRLLKTMGGKAA
jgi:hypothetical protein